MTLQRSKGLHRIDDSQASDPFRRYSVAASGLLAATCVAGHAEAAVVHTDIADLTANPGELLFFNLARGEADVGTPTPVPTPEGEPNWFTSVSPDHSAWRIGNYFNGYDEVFINDFPENRAVRKKATKKRAPTKRVASNPNANPPGTSVAALRLGDSIDADQFPEVDNHLDADGDGEWEGGTSGYLGLRMSDPASGGDLFGWARVTYDDANNQVTLHEFAYDDSGQTLTAGAVSQPPAVPSVGAAGLGVTLLSMGAVGLRLLRSRNREEGEPAREG